MVEKDASSETGELTLWDRVALIWLFPFFVIRWLATFALHANPALHWRQRLALTFLQAQRATFTLRQRRWLVRRVPTKAAIQQYCASHGIPHETVTLDTPSSSSSSTTTIPQATLHFLTPPTAPKNNDEAPAAAAAAAAGPGPTTLLYFHGGGFVNPLRGAAHLPFALRCAAACRAARLAVLEYALAPEHPYPAQLAQAVAALRYLLVGKKNEGGLSMRPGDVVLAGDSAGGQLVGALLAHVARPSPYAPPLDVADDGQLSSALFVCPWAGLGVDSASFGRNYGRDYLGARQVDEFKAAWKGKGDEVWADLCAGKGAEEVWRRVFAPGSKGLVKKVMVTVGTAEVLLDCCREFAVEYVRAETVVARRDTDWRAFEGKDRVLAECEGEVHVQVGLDEAVGYDGGSMMRAIMSWLATV
ncbi:hypothetical protein VTK56DRAFT_6674 [Thermocarpiscus australiensis]